MLYSRVSLYDIPRGGEGARPENGTLFLLVNIQNELRHKQAQNYFLFLEEKEMVNIYNLI